MTCFALGIIISVTKKDEEIEEELKTAAKREEALQKLIDAELDAEKEEEDYSIVDKAANPMNAVMNK
jgi:cell division protein FtsW